MTDNTLMLGTKNAEVKRLQARLNELGYKDGGNRFLSEDGSFGPRTEEAVNGFKDAVLPGGNMGADRGKVSVTTWEFLKSAVPLAQHLIWLPPFEYNACPGQRPGDGGKPWSDKDILDFAEFESGNKLTWDSCAVGLLKAKAAFEAEMAAFGWTIRYTSAYRPLVYQAHFYDLFAGPASKTDMGRKHRQNPHAIRSASYPRRSGSPHIMGIAFDAVITENGRTLNPAGAPINAELAKVANACGLKTPPVNDTVHWELIRC